MKLVYSTSIAQIKTDNVTAKDLDIVTGANKTLRLDHAVYRDELQNLLLQNYVSPGAKVVINSAEGSVTYKTGSDLGDYTVMNVQINHDWEVGTAVSPHIHWWQASSNVPNWLLRYRWQENGQLQSTTWTPAPWSSNAFTYSTGTLNQITGFGTITPSTNAVLSDILQLRLTRDGSNASLGFATTDLYATDVDAMNLDVHIQVDTMGSRQEYVK